MTNHEDTAESIGAIAGGLLGVAVCALGLAQAGVAVPVFLMLFVCAVTALVGVVVGLAFGAMAGMLLSGVSRRRG